MGDYIPYWSFNRICKYNDIVIVIIYELEVIKWVITFLIGVCTRLESAIKKNSSKICCVIEQNINCLLKQSKSSESMHVTNRETGLSPPVIYFTDRCKAVLLLWIFYVFYVLCLLCLCALLYICVL